MPPPPLPTYRQPAKSTGGGCLRAILVIFAIFIGLTLLAVVVGVAESARRSNLTPEQRAAEDAQRAAEKKDQEEALARKAAEREAAADARQAERDKQAADRELQKLAEKVPPPEDTPKEKAAAAKREAEFLKNVQRSLANKPTFTRSVDQVLADYRKFSKMDKLGLTFSKHKVDKDGTQIAVNDPELIIISFMTVGKKNPHTAMMFAKGDGTLRSGGNVLLAASCFLRGLAPELDAREAGQVLLQMMDDDKKGDSGKYEGKSVKFTASYIKGMGFMMTAEPK